VRALYRLCHHLNSAGYSAAIQPLFGPIECTTAWSTPVHLGPTMDSIVIYPEIVVGNPLNARRVVRWTLNNPGLLGGETRYSHDEMVFTFNPDRLAIVSAAAGEDLGQNRVLRVELIDPMYIYPDFSVPKTIDCFFVHKGPKVRTEILTEAGLVRVEDNTPTMQRLGELLRRTRTLYSYDHASTILKEAAICGCRVLVVHDDGRLLDPETCGCAHNVHWDEGFRVNYAKKFNDSSFIYEFIRELSTRWVVTADG
jgi:hypothetical protein